MNAPEWLFRAIFPDRLAVLQSSLPEQESVEWMEQVVCQALAEIDAAEPEAGSTSP